jgi:flagellar basal-body rod protein FlgB
MAISFEKVTGIHEQALRLRTQRAELLANNIANADTPGFKARDVDFKAVMQAQLSQQKSGLKVTKTNQQHMSLEDSRSSGKLMYRNPTQPAIDGNTVDTQTEIVQFTKNAMDFQSSFLFLNSRFKGLTRAIKGE